MFKNTITSLLRINPVLLAGLYVLIQAYLYFCPYIHETTGSFYFVTADPDLFPHDIIRTSTLGTSTYYYKFMYLLLGQNMLNPFFLFIPYVITCSLVGWGLFRVGELIGGKNRSVGILMLVLFLVDKSPFTGYLSLTRPDYNYQHFTLPILIFAVYFLLKEKNLYFTLLMVLGFAFHVRNTLILGLVVLPLIAYRMIKDPKTIPAFILPGLLVLPKALSLFQGMYTATAFTVAEKQEYLRIMFMREEEEGAIVFNEAAVLELIVYGLVAIAGVWSARYIKDKSLRRSVYFCHAGVYFTFGVGLLLRVIDRFMMPMGEVMMIGYGRACIWGTLLAMASLANFAYLKLEIDLNRKKAFSVILLVAGLWFLSINSLYIKSLQGFFSDWISMKMLIKVFVSIGVSVISYVIIRKLNFKLNAGQVVFLLFIFAFAYTAAKVPGQINRSYKIGYQYFPLIPDFSVVNVDAYRAGQWAKKNTGKGEIFLTVNGDGRTEEDFCNSSGSRIYLQRSLWCQTFVGAYGNAEAFREWKRRREVLRQFLPLQFSEWGPLFKHEEINYVFALKDIAWPNPKNIVYQNERYVVYDVRQKDRE